MGSPVENNILAQYAIGFGANIGCGDVQVGNSIGVDIKQTRAARIIADCSCLPFSDDSLDYIISSNCLEHSYFSPMLVLHEWLRCVKVGGIVAVIVPDGEKNPGTIGSNTKEGRLQEGGHLHIFTLSILTECMKFAGAHIVKAEQFSREPYWKTPSILIVGKKTNRYIKNLMPKSRALWLKYLLKTAMPKAYTAKLKGQW